MEFLQPYMNYILAVLGLLALLVVLLLVFRMFNGRARGRKGMRLGIVEYCEIDQSRRLVLLRRDGVEHLVMIGGAQDILIESGIGDDFVEENPSVSRASPPEEVIPFRAPRAPVFGAKRPVLRPVDQDDDGQGPA